MSTSAGSTAPAPNPGTPAPGAGSADDAWRTSVSPSRAPVDWQPYLLGALVLVVLTLFVAELGSAPNGGFVDGAAVLAMVSLVAIGIERAIEAFWSLAARWKDAWWPLNEIGEAIDAQVENVNLSVRPVFDTALSELNKAKELLAEGDSRVDRITEQIASVQKQRDAFIAEVTKINALVKDDQRVGLIATAAVQASSRVDSAIGDAIPAVREAFNDATIVATGAVDLLAGFKDNPAKKVLSLAIGTGLGLLVAGFLRLDLFAAAGAPLPTPPPWGFLGLRIPVLPFMGVAVTGLVLGLGSNPTHQVVSWATDAAKARKTAALGVPDTSGGAGEAQPGPILSGGLRAALAAAATVGTRDALPALTTIRVPTERLMPSAGVDLDLGAGAIDVDVGGLVGADMVRRTDSGRKILTIPGDAVAAGAGMDPRALRGQSVQADMTGIAIPGLEEESHPASPPRVRPVTMNLRRR